MANSVGWFEIYVQDMQRAKKFYETVFAVQLDKLDTGGMSDLLMMSFPSDMTQYGCAGALVKMDGMPSGGNSTLVYFASQDCALETSRVLAAGGKVFKEKTSIGQYGFISLVIDTEGNMIGIHSM